MERHQFKSDWHWDVESVGKMISLGCLSADYVSTGVSGAQESTPLEDLLNHRILQPAERTGLIGHIDRWDILDVIGMGGMGIVLLAEERASSVKKAIKVLRPQYLSDPGILGHFLEEIHVVTHLNHPYIVPLENEEEEIGGTAFMVMPYYPQGSLDSYLAQHPALVTKTIIKLIRGIAEGLAYAHSKGIIHFDLKPGNILLETTDHPRIADFGLAKNLATGISSPESARAQKGTLPYMSPGMLSGQQEYMLSDIYSLGAVLYEMLSGSRPYGDFKGTDVRKHILDIPPTPVLTINRAANSSLVHLTESMMHREATKRPPSLEHVIELLERIEKGSNPVPTPIKTVEEMPLLKSGKHILAKGFAISVLLLGFLLLIKLTLGHFATLNPPTTLTHRKSKLVKEFDSIHVARWDRVHFVQWDGLDGMELVVEEEQNIMVFDNNGSLLKRWPLNQPGARWSRLSKPLDVSGDERTEIAVEWGNTNKTEVVYFDQNPRPVARFSIIPSPHSDRNSTFTTTLSFNSKVTTETSANNRPLIIGQSGTYFSDLNASPWKRGIHAFDIETGDQIWEAHFGSPPNGVRPIDLDHDGKLDFVTGTSSVNNGNMGPDGSSDSLPYIYAVSARGEIVWRKQIGEPGDAWNILGTGMNQNNKTVIYAAMGTGEFAINKNAPEHLRVVMLDSEGTPVKSFSTSMQLQHLKLIQSPADDYNAVLLSDQVGNVYLLTEDQSWSIAPTKSAQLMSFSKHKTSGIDRVTCVFLNFGPYTKPNAKEIAVVTYEEYNSGDLNSNDASRSPHITEYRTPTIHILNTDLETITQLSFDTVESDRPLFRSVDLDEDGVLEILRTGDSVEVYSMR